MRFTKLEYLILNHLRGQVQHFKTLENAVFTALSDGTLGAGQFVTGAAAQDAQDRIIYNNATGALFYDSDGTGAVAAIQFADVTPGLALTNLDFR
jgi:serralysin